MTDLTTWRWIPGLVFETALDMPFLILSVILVVSMLVQIAARLHSHILVSEKQTDLFEGFAYKVSWIMRKEESIHL